MKKLARRAAAFGFAQVLLPLWRLLPEGAVRNTLRRRMYAVRVGIPRELLINRGDTVIQVGMWRPASIVRVARAVGSSGRLILIEASSAGAEQARTFFASKGLSQCEVIHAAAWSVSGTVELELTDDPSGNQVSGVGADLPHSRSGRTESVRAVTLDEVARERGITTVGYLEVTVNGAELDVLRGAADVLPNVARIFAAGMMRDAQTKQPLNATVSAYLDERGFRTVISRRGRAVGSGWGRIDGHVFAARS